MKILFLNPSYGRGFCKTARWFAKSRAREQRHPDYLCTAISVLERDGHNCGFIDGAAGNISIEETRRFFKTFNPEAVVINATTPSIDSDLQYAKMCKEETKEDLFTIMVGPHASAEAEDVLKSGEPFLDAVARREYDYTLREFANTGGLYGLEGISYINNGEVIHNPDRPFIEDLDGLPFPAWHHIDLRDYYAPAKRNPFITVITGRGCEGSCTFCLFPQVMYGRNYRPRSIKNVLDEIEYNRKIFPSLREVMFEDDTLTLARHLTRIEEMCRGILRRNLKITWSCNARPDILDVSILRLMKKSGCRMLCVGFESGDEKLLANLKKGTSISAIKKFAMLCKEVGLLVHGCFVIGAPGETQDTIEKTVRLASNLPIDTVQFSGLCPYPGTEFYNWCMKNGYITARDWRDWVDEDGEQRTITDYPGLSCEAMNRAIDRSLYGFYLRPSYLFSQIFSPRSIYDVKARVEGLFNFANHALLARRKTRLN